MGVDGVPAADDSESRGREDGAVGANGAGDGAAIGVT